MATLSLDEETSEQVIERLTRELDAVTHQCQVSHRMAIFHKSAYEKAERKRIRAEKALNTWRKKLLGIPKDQRLVTEETLALWEAEADTDTSIR
jgi:hypothetical protein